VQQPAQQPGEQPGKQQEQPRADAVGEPPSYCRLGRQRKSNAKHNTNYYQLQYQRRAGADHNLPCGRGAAAYSGKPKNRAGFYQLQVSRIRAIIIFQNTRSA